MTSGYLLLKFFHVLIAILALGTSAGLGIVLEFYGSHPTHGPYLLRAITRIVAFFVLPGYVLMLVTGLLMVNMAWPFTTRWIQGAMVLWAAGLAGLVIFLAALRRQLRLLETQGPTTAAYQRASLLARGLGGGLGFVGIYILYLMVFKPSV